MSIIFIDEEPNDDINWDDIPTLELSGLTKHVVNEYMTYYTNEEGETIITQLST